MQTYVGGYGQMMFALFVEQRERQKRSKKVGRRIDKKSCKSGDEA